jgi:predicted DNA-binding protein
MTPTPKKLGRPRLERKPHQFNIRMSRELRAELDLFAKLGGRPVSYQIEHMISIAKMMIEFCDGSDNLKVVEDRLKKARETLEKAKN